MAGKSSTPPIRRRLPEFRPEDDRRLLTEKLIELVRQLNAEIAQVDTLDDVIISSRANNDFLQYDGSAKRWKNRTFATSGMDDRYVNVAGDTMTGVLAFIAGSASAPAITADGDTNTGIFFPAADTIGFSTAGSERARIDSAGDLGVGTTNPQALLHVIGSTGVRVAQSQTGNDNSYYTELLGFYADEGMRLRFGGHNLIASKGFTTPETLVFYTYDTGASASAERMRINNGNLLIGTTTDDFSNKLQVAGGIAAQEITLKQSGIDHVNLEKTSTGGTTRITATNSADNTAGQWRMNWDAQTYGAWEAWVPANASGSQTEAFEIGDDYVAVPSGPLLIGTTTDDGSNKLQVSGSAVILNDLEIQGVSPRIYWNETDVTDKNFTAQVAGGTFQIQERDDSKTFLRNVFEIAHGSSGAIRFPDSGKRVLIGTSSDDGSNLLQVNGGAAMQSAVIGEGQASDLPLLLKSSDSRSFITFQDNLTTNTFTVSVGAEGDDLIFRSNQKIQGRFTSGDNLTLFTQGAGQHGGGAGVAFISNAATAPTTNPSNGGILYCEGGALKYRGSAGSTTVIAAA